MMNDKMTHFKLGASIYVPATRNEILSIANEERIKKIRIKSVIFCTEDSVLESDVPKALKNLEDMVKNTSRSEKMLKFIRVRNEDVLNSILQMSGIENIDGFVLPKITANNFDNYLLQFEKNGLKKNNFFIMPTLETKEAFNNAEMEKLCEKFLQPHVKDNILSLRIGGNDLLNILGIRRSRYRTIYETPLGVTIPNLVTIFKPNGFNLTAPVCEFLHDNEVLNKEVPSDLEHGLFGKTAIHPDQISIIETAYMPTEHDFEMAEAILKENAPAVFGMHGTMCEVTTHSNWAREILMRAEIYGVYGVKR